MVAGAIKPPLWVAALGRCVRNLSRYAHGVELPLSADAMAFSMGIVIATGMLHLGSIAFGLRENYLSHRVFEATQPSSTQWFLPSPAPLRRPLSDAQNGSRSRFSNTRRTSAASTVAIQASPAPNEINRCLPS